MSDGRFAQDSDAAPDDITIPDPTDPDQQGLNPPAPIIDLDGDIAVGPSRPLGPRRLALLREVVLPGAAPSIVTGLAIGMGTSWFCLVTAEMISGQWGLGYYTWASYNIQNYDEVVVGMLLIGLFGMGSSGLVKRVGASLTPWYAAGGKVR